jgi:hypothetical protein
VLVEAAWSAIKTPGPLRAFCQRVRARRGAQIAIVATARKLVCLAWQLLNTERDYAYKRQTIIDKSSEPSNDSPALRPATATSINQAPSPPSSARSPNSNSPYKPNSPTNASSKTGKQPATTQLQTPPLDFLTEKVSSRAVTSDRSGWFPGLATG